MCGVVACVHSRVDNIIPQNYCTTSTILSNKCIKFVAWCRLCNVRYGQVACIREAYESKHGRSLTKAVIKKFSGDMEDALLSLLFDPVEIFARGLKKAFHGLGTDKVPRIP